MLNDVGLTITSKTNGFAAVVPYSHARGLQTIVDRLGQLCAVVYRIPAYQIRIDGGDTYTAVRFGLQNTGAWPAPATRKCDAGLFHAHTCRPTWNPGYSPHSFRGMGTPGAWVLLLGRGFLIHEGPDRARNGVGGSLGCVEILDGKWDAFLKQVQKLGNGSCAAIGRAGKLEVTIEAGSYPTGTLIGALPMMK